MLTTTQPQARKTTRLDLRVRPDVKRIIEQAAETLGISTTDFASAALVNEARAVLERHHRITLNTTNRDRFLSALAAEEEPNAALVQAAHQFNHRYGA